MAGHPFRSATRLCLGGPLPRQLADRPQAPPCPRRRFPQGEMPPSGTTGYQPSFQRVVSLTGAGCLRVTHPSAARDAILCHPPPDLHVLGTPPALTLSQDQTLHKKSSIRRYPGLSAGIPPRRTSHRPVLQALNYSLVATAMLPAAATPLELLGSCCLVYSFVWHRMR